MIESLHIRNLALIPSLDIEFQAGLNVITGETGSGKSLIISAINLLGGGRATSGVIRKGEKSAEAAAVIRLDTLEPQLLASLTARLDTAGLPACEENRLLLRRVITESGSRAYVNASPVTIGFLKELGDLLIDIHGPHDNQSLLHSTRQLELLDSFAGTLPLLAECRQLYAQHAAIRKQLDDLAHDGLNPEETDLLKHQLREIKDANLQPGEDEELYQKYKRAQNSRRLLELASAASASLANADNSLCDQLSTVLRTLNELETLDPQNGAQFPEQLVSAFDLIQSLAENLDDYTRSLDLDPEEAQSLEERLELVQKLKRKYGPTLDDVFAAQQRIRDRIQAILGRGDLIQSLRQQLADTTAALNDACARLDHQRREAASPLADAIADKLRVLGFSKAAFTIDLQPAPAGPTGANTVEYLFSPNLGEDLQPLRLTASSGETARVMLAIKTVLSEADAMPVLVFDEIDANVGGRVAPTVAQELRAVARRHQVFCITHLPPVAAAAQNHYLVEKHTQDGRSITTMTALDPDACLAELVRMLGANGDSAAARSHAVELIRQANSATNCHA